MVSSFNTEAPRVSLRNLFPHAVFVGSNDILVRQCHRSAEQCRTGDVFAACVDALRDGGQDADLAVTNGASAIISERLLPISIPQILVPDARSAYAILCHELANRPCDKLLTIGVMGTHGKTTAGLLVASMMKSLGGSVAYHTSLGASNGKNNNLIARSDASAEQLTEWLSDSIAIGTPTAVIELSDSILCRRAASGLKFDIILMPNLRRSQRGTELVNRGAESAMLRAVQQLKEHGLVIFNADDARLNRWVRRHDLPVLGYGLDADADVRGRRLQRQVGEQTLMVTAGPSLMPMTSQLVGDHNARHLLAAVATGYAFGLNLFEIVGSVERLQRIPGRMQSVACGQPFSVYIDTADQADRLAVSLHALAPTGSVTCVAEVPETCDHHARAAYGRVLERSASRFILTQSRQSGRSGQAAMWEVLDGCQRPAAATLLPNRNAAIEFALRSARPGEQVLLAGWGANQWTSGEDRQVKNDSMIAERILRALEKYPSVESNSATANPPFQIVKH